MDEYDWGGWDTAMNDYYGNDGTGGISDVSNSLPNDMFTFGGYGPDPIDGGGTGQNFDWMSGFQQENPYGPQELNFVDPNFNLNTTDFGNLLGTISGGTGGGGAPAGGAKAGTNILDTITKVLGGSGNNANYASLLSGVLKGLGANQQVKANNQNSQQMVDYLNQSRQYQSPADFGAVPGSTRAGATDKYNAAQAALDAFNRDPNSNAGNVANKAQISKVLNAQAAMHGNRNNFNHVAPALAAAYADSDMKYQNQYMKDRDANAGYAGLNNFYKGGETSAMAQALALGNLGNSPYYAAGQNVLSNNSYDQNPDLSSIFKLLQGVSV